MLICKPPCELRIEIIHAQPMNQHDQFSTELSDDIGHRLWGEFQWTTLPAQAHADCQRVVGYKLDFNNFAGLQFNKNDYF